MAPLLWFGLGRVGLLYGVASVVVVVWKHRENLARLRHGTENRLSLMKAKRT
jgi:glycerol-3-phosphate acyltransferase PlsY